MTLELDPALLPPPARREEFVETLHGVEISDPYRWLEEQESPETREWVTAQNAFTLAQLRARPERPALETRLHELLSVDMVGIPTERGGWYYLSRQGADQQQPAIYRRRGLDGPDELLVDPATLSADMSVTASLLDISKDGGTLVYGVRRGGEDELQVRLMDAATGVDHSDILPRGRYFGVALLPGGDGLIYAQALEEGPRVRLHRFGSDPASDPILFGEGFGPDKIVGAEVTPDGRWLLITVYHGSAAKQTEIYVQNLADAGPIVPVVTGIEARFLGEIAGDRLILLTNLDAPRGRLLSVDLADPSRELWREIVAEDPEAILESHSAVGGRILVTWLRNVSSEVRAYSEQGELLGEVVLPGLGTASRPFGRWESDEAFFGFTSFATPRTIFRLEVSANRSTLWARSAVPVECERFVVEQRFAASRDGVQVPFFLVRDRSTKPDGSRPVLLTAYGGFNMSLTPSFSAVSALWAESGGLYVVANLRGGGEFGEAWHEAGMREKKQNVFDDLFAVTERLIADGWTRPERIAISGGSNGGLLVGAALTQRPELFGAVVCSVPLLDMLRYHKFLVAAYWIPEYGSADDAGDFPFLYAYSPYHRLREGDRYPATLFVTGDSDTRVAPLHARKMAAALQYATGSGRPVLLHYDTQAGHSGGQPRAKVIADQADIQTFLFWQLGFSASQNKPADQGA